MNQKDLIKYGLLALGAYLVWKYIEDHGGLSAVLGTVTAPPTQPVVTPPGHTDTIQPTTKPPTLQPPVLDMAGLTVEPDINDSLSGTVKINGVPIRLSIITGDGRIFDSSGAEVTASLEASGVDVVALRTAFANAGAGMSGFVSSGWSPSWTM